MSIKLGASEVVASVFFVASFAAAFGASTLKKENNRLKSENNRLAAELTTLQTNYQLTEDAYNALSETKLQIRTQTRTVVKHIKASPKSDDALLAPVLKSALEALP